MTSLWAKGFQRSVGADAFAKLSPAMKSFHGGGGKVAGPFIVTRGKGILMGLMARIGSLPPPSKGILTCLSDGTGREQRTFCDGHIFESRFQDTKNGFVENVLGGLIQFRFHHDAKASKDLVPFVLSLEQCEDLYRLPEFANSCNPSLPPDQKPTPGICLDDTQHYGWKGESTDIYLFWGSLRLPSFFQQLLYVKDVNIPHRDGQGWYVQVELFCPFGLLTSYIGHVRIVPPAIQQPPK